MHSHKTSEPNQALQHFVHRGRDNTHLSLICRQKYFQNLHPKTVPSQHTNATQQTTQSPQVTISKSTTMFSVSLFTTTQEPANLTAGTRPGYGLHGRGMAIQFLTGTRDFLFRRANLSSQVKRPRRISDRSPPYIAEVYNGWSYTSALL